MKRISVNFAKFERTAGIFLLAILMGAAPSSAQKKSKTKEVPPADLGEDLKSAIRPPDPQLIDQTIGESLGYWQIGDADSLHKYYADDAVIVSGAWEPPMIGWDNFAKAYRTQRAQISGERIDRTNTVIKVNGDSAWATYQFVYAAQMEGRPVQFHGHTTLVLAKRGDRWVITLNHSSIVDASVPTPVAAIGPDPSGKPQTH